MGVAMDIIQNRGTTSSGVSTGSPATAMSIIRELGNNQPTVKAIVKTPTKVVSSQVKVTQSAPKLTPIQQAQKTLGDIGTGISNTLQNVVKGINMTLTPPKVSPKLPNSAMSKAQPTPIGPPAPVKIVPGQKKIDLGQIAGNVVNKIGDAQQSVFGIKLGTLKENINDIGAILSGNTMEEDYKAYNKLDPWSKLNEATKVFGMFPTLSGMSGEIKGAKDVASFVRGLIGGYGAGSILNYAAQEPKKRSIGEAIKPNLDNMLFAYFTGSTGLPNPFEILKKTPDISKADYIKSRDFLKNLGVKEEVFSNPEALKKSYFDLAKKYHPDLPGGNAKIFKGINDAYKKVTNTYYDVPKTGDKVNIAGLLGDGEKTPNEIINTVMKNGLEKTPEGKAVIKAAAEANSKGMNITIEKAISPEELVKMTPEQKQIEVDRRQTQSFIKADTEQPKALRIGGDYTTLTPEQSVALRNEVKLIPEGTKEQLHLNLESKAIGANENKLDLSALASKYPDVKKALANAGIKIEGGNVITPETDKSLLTSEQAKQIESQQTEYNKQVREKIAKLQEDLDLQRQENEIKKSILDQFSGETIKGMRMLKRSMIVAENRGLDMNEVQKLPSYDKYIYSVMESIGTNNEQEALRYIREDLPDAIVKADTNEALKQIKVLRTHIIPKEAKAPLSQLPQGEGKLKASKLEARMKGIMDNVTQDQIDELGLATYQEMNKKETIAKAAEYVTNNKEDAIKVLEGKLDPPKGVPPEAIYIALTQSATGDMTLITKLASLQATALGQRISLLSELDKNSPIKLLNEVYKIREAQFEKRYAGKKVAQVKKAVVENIKKQVKAPDKSDWNAFLNSIEC